MAKGLKKQINPKCRGLLHRVATHFQSIEGWDNINCLNINEPMIEALIESDILQRDGDRVMLTDHAQTILYKQLTISGEFPQI